MNFGFWEQLEKPIMALAPMADVTDAAFRRIIAKYGKPDVMWTEFVACDGLASDEGRKKLLLDFEYTENERPIVAQIFGAQPEHYYVAAKLVSELGFDGVDINMGCPERNVCKQGAGAAMVKDFKLAQECIYQTMRGAGDLPVSVKIRIGFNVNQIEEWIPALLETQPAVITIHGRTRREMSKVPARWDVIARAVEIRDAYCNEKERTLVLGNGDVVDREDALSRVEEFGVDGVMIGRGIFGNPWLFSRSRDYKEVGLEEKLAVMLEHTFLFEELFKERKNFNTMKKHYKAYVSGFDGAKELRVKLMECENASEVEGVVQGFLGRV